MSKIQKITVVRIVFAIVATLILGIVPLPDVTALKILLYLIPYIVIGYNVLYCAFRNILNGQVFDEQFLMTLATIGAFFIEEYPEAVMVMTFFQIGELFEKLAVGKSRKSITELMDIVPDTANLFVDGNISQVSPDEVSKGDIIVVRPGEKIPLDGVITQGETYVDTSALTGESLPRKTSVGDSVISGCVNLQSLIYVRVENEYFESTATKILELVESSTMKKAKTESFITRFARYYTPAVVVGAVLISVIASIITGEVFSSIRRGLIFLVVSCPCALVISVPLSFFGGIGGASKSGILIKGSEYIEALSKTDIAVFDKTGTLTEGSFTVTKIKSQNISNEELIEYAAYAESTSTHPIAKSICRAYGKPIDASLIGDMIEYPGMGIGAIYKDRRILVGNKKLMENNGIVVKEDSVGNNTVFIALDKDYCGYLTLDDKPKKNSKKAIEELKAIGVTKTVMLTGDSAIAAKFIGDELEINEVYAELMPSDKVRLCEDLLEKKKKGKTLVFAGDGINDAPVLSRADVGIAMGAMGSDAAIEAADVVLMDDDPEKVSKAIKIAKKTMRIVRQNIIFALSVKGIVLILGAFGYANMWIAVFADVGVSVLAILNAMRAMRRNEKNNFKNNVNLSKST